MEEETKYLNENYIYPYDFEEELDNIMYVEYTFGNYLVNNSEMYFNLSDCDSKSEGHKKIH